ncbi:uncharacterized protein C8Q71DRAFT_907712 [Rhodofomes roseus]|uniref:F-box domain-containing protein n=1 Tax=Rhodofomes roseus TaxID=34475 RepID=A0ABQ8KEC2_9APHY|nr:uncharacterized protein C8Q71DRAFT_907712 [Rhodofomes roseus]KAH9836064.1 hypothetical protein C8Q71DRAFT_907712 [Rhodofomes roseus]
MASLVHNHDVLDMITRMLSPQQAIPFSSSSRDFHAAARKHAFSSINLENGITGASRLIKMYQSLLKSMDNRTIWPRKLEVDASILRPDLYGPLRIRRRFEQLSLDALIGILKNAYDLEVLYLDGCEDVFERDQRIAECVVTLPNIAELRLGGMGRASVDVLDRMISRPKMLWLYFGRVTPSQMLHATRAAVLDHVEELVVDGFHLVHREAQREVDSRRRLGKSYPSLRKLTLIGCTVYPFLDLFLDIRWLRALQCRFPEDVDEVSDNDSPDDQPAHAGFSSQRPLQLEHVSTLSDDAEHIPAPPSNSLELVLLSEPVFPSEGLSDKVSGAVLLRLWLQGREVMSCSSLTRMVSSGPSRVRYLILRMDSQSSMTRWMAKLPTTLVSSQLICMRVETEVETPDGTLSEDSEDSEDESDKEDSPNSAWPDLLRRMETVHVSAIPSLRFFSVLCDVRRSSYTGGLVCSKLTWGRVERDGDSRVVKPISNVVGECIHRYLQSPEFCKTLQFDEDAALRYA